MGRPFRKFQTRAVKRDYDPKYDRAKRAPNNIPDEYWDVVRPNTRSWKSHGKRRAPWGNRTNKIAEILKYHNQD